MRGFPSEDSLVLNIHKGHPCRSHPCKVQKRRRLWSLLKRFARPPPRGSTHSIYNFLINIYGSNHRLRLKSEIYFRVKTLTDMNEIWSVTDKTYHPSQDLYRIPDANNWLKILVQRKWRIKKLKSLPTSVQHLFAVKTLIDISSFFYSLLVSVVQSCQALKW